MEDIALVTPNTELLIANMTEMTTVWVIGNYRQISNIRRTIVGNTLADNSDVVGASPIGTAPTTSSFST